MKRCNDYSDLSSTFNTLRSKYLDDDITNINKVEYCHDCLEFCLDCLHYICYYHDIEVSNDIENMKMLFDILKSNHIDICYSEQIYDILYCYEKQNLSMADINVCYNAINVCYSNINDQLDIMLF